MLPRCTLRCARTFKFKASGREEGMYMRDQIMLRVIPRGTCMRSMRRYSHRKKAKKSSDFKIGGEVPSAKGWRVRVCSPLHTTLLTGGIYTSFNRSRRRAYLAVVVVGHTPVKINERTFRPPVGGVAAENFFFVRLPCFSGLIWV